MKYLSLLAVACLTWSAVSTVDAAAPFYANSRVQDTSSKVNSYIVVLKGNNTADSFMPTFNNIVNRSNARGGLRPKLGRKFRAIPGFTFTASRATLTELLSMDEVAYVEQDAEVVASGSQASVPSWGLARVSSTTKGGSTYNYPDSAGSGVTAYVIDTGINTAHVDFGGRATMGANFITGSPNTDENGHGTHVAGTIGGTRYGVAKNVALVGIKVLAKNGRGPTSGIVGAIDWVISASRGKRAVINMSLGGGFSNAINDAVARANRANIPVFAAAGNDPDVDACDGSPSSSPLALTVGGSDVNDRAYLDTSPGECVDIIGPAVDITSAWIGSSNAKITISGTSMATPHVAGVAALYMGADSNLNTPLKVYQRLQSTAAKDKISGLHGEANLLVYNGGGL
ncbi:subtilisin-like serine protease [Mortierella antarctica]|nr:subtilisin-like serine protease [Mortierella alpina]KAF9986067.1 subtilisin-like serine protease [Mortierella antarctica]